MKTVYQAIRALLYPGQADARAGRKGAHPLKVANPKLYRTLETFELRVRGFRDLLDTNPSPWRGIYPDQERKFLCSNILDQQTTNMLRALCTSYQLPQVESLAVVLDAPDSTSRVLLALRAEMRDLAKVILTGVAGDYSALVEMEQAENGYVSFKLEVYCPHLNAVAERTLDLPETRCTTLREAHAFYYHNQVLLQEVLESVPAWPEFQPTAEHLLKERLTKQVKDLADSLTPEERAFLQKNWALLRPAK